MPLHKKVAVVVALTALALLASFTLAWPTRDVVLAGRPFTLSGRTLLGLIVIGLACAGTDALVRGHAKAQPEQSPRVSLHWILPAAMTAVAWALLAQPLRLEQRIAIVLAVSAVLLLLIAVEYHTADLAAPWRPAVRLALQLATYGVAALVYATVRLTIPLRANAALSIAVASAAMGLRLLSENERILGRVGLSALGLGALLGVISSLLYPRIPAPVAYSLLLVVYLYVATGLLRQLLLGQLQPHDQALAAAEAQGRRKGGRGDRVL